MKYKELFFYDTNSGDFPHHSHFFSMNGTILKYDFSLVSHDVVGFEINIDNSFTYINKQVSRKGQIYGNNHKRFCVEHEIVALVYFFLKNKRQID